MLPHYQIASCKMIDDKLSMSALYGQRCWRGKVGGTSSCDLTEIKKVRKTLGFAIVPERVAMLGFFFLSQVDPFEIEKYILGHLFLRDVDLFVL